MSATGVKKINASMESAEFFDSAQFQIGIFTNKGKKSSKAGKNEDCSGFVLPTPSQVALLVADGMGGHKNGDKASKIAITSILGRTTHRRRPFKPAQMLEKIERAHQKIFDMKSDAGSTVVVAVIQNDGLWIYAVGDSVGALFSADGKIQYKSFEHSVVGFATESGLLEEKEAQEHDQSNVILNCLGFHDTRLESSFKLPIYEGETVFLCTDGLTEILTLTEVSQFLKSSDFEAGFSGLVNKCLELRANCEQYDDISLVVCRKK